MKASEVIKMLQSAIADAKKSGVKQIAADDLETFANDLASKIGASPDDVAAGDSALESYKAYLASLVQEREHKNSSNLELLRATITSGQSALRSAILINGGAAAALLAFAGSIWSSANSKPTLLLISKALFHFVLGVLSAAVASGSTYLSQAGFGREFGKASRFLGVAGQYGAIVLILMSYALFFYAARLAFQAIP